MTLLPADRIDIEQRVRMIKQSLRLDNVAVIDPMTVITKIKSLFPDFNYKRLPDKYMNGRSAYFEYGLHNNTIVLSETIFCNMNSGDLKSLRILLEEVGHFFLGHKHVRNHNETRSAAEKTVFQIRKDEAEAEYFAACFIGSEREA
jgi:IrrE N-terminal-like domain